MSNPGSYSEYLLSHQGDSSQSSIENYSNALQNYRVELAESRHITLDQLHSMRLTDLASTMVSQVVELT